MLRRVTDGVIGFSTVVLGVGIALLSRDWLQLLVGLWVAFVGSYIGFGMFEGEGGGDGRTGRR